MSSSSAPPPPTDRPRQLPWTVVFAGIGVIAAAAFGWTLDGHFVGDDFGYVGRFAGLPVSAWPTFFTHGWADGLWDPALFQLRPTTALSFILDGKI